MVTNSEVVTTFNGSFGALDVFSGEGHPLDELDARKEGILTKTIQETIPDGMAKESLTKAVADEETLRNRLALVSESTLATPEILKRGLSILGDMQACWETSDLSTRQKLRRFVFPEGVTGKKSDVAMTESEGASCCESVTVWNPPSLSVQGEGSFCPEKVTVVAAGGFEPSTLRV